MNQGITTAENEQRWSMGAWVAAGFALFIFVFNIGTALSSTTRPTDGWMVTGDITSDEPEIIFDFPLTQASTPIQAGDRLVAINGQTVVALLDAQYTFYRLALPDWPDGTVLHYDILRAGEPLSLRVPIQRLPFWSYYRLYVGANLAGLTQLLGGLFFFFVGVLVFLLRPRERAAHALLFIGVAFFFNAVPANFSPPTLFYPEFPPSIPFDTWTLAINPSLMYLALVFPRPKLPLRRFPTLGVLLLYLPWPLAFNLAYLLHLQDRSGYLRAAFAIYPVQVILMLLVTLVSLAHSALTVRDPVGRSQFKWMLTGVFSFAFIGVGGWLVSSYLFPETMAQGNWLLTTIGWFLLPLCLAIAITRYRLFDIDVIIRRTLVYAILTATLALVYFGMVILLEGLLRSLVGSSGQVATVVSTLAVAALVTPLRRRVQEVIDRRFYRRKYNAEQALAEFATAARNETDLAVLTAQVVTIVQNTMQPEQVSLWLKEK